MCLSLPVCPPACVPVSTPVQSIHASMCVPGRLSASACPAARAGEQSMPFLSTHILCDLLGSPDPLPFMMWGFGPHSSFMELHVAPWHLSFEAFPVYTMGVDYTAGPPPRLRSSPLSKLVKPHSVSVHHSGSGYNSLDAVPASVTYYFWEGGKSLNSSVCFLPPCV